MGDCCVRGRGGCACPAPRMLGSSCRNADDLQVDPWRACKVHERQREKKGVEGKPVDEVESLRKGEEVRGAGFAGGDVEF